MLRFQEADLRTYFKRQLTVIPLLFLVIGFGWTSLTRAQGIVVNEVICPAAAVVFSQAGMQSLLPEGCSGNGKVCSDAAITIKPTGISIDAPPQCLRATGLDEQPTLVTLNGVSCQGAVAKIVAGLTVMDVSIKAPLDCIRNQMPAPYNNQFLEIGRCPEAGITQTPTGIDLYVPVVCLQRATTSWLTPVLYFLLD